MKKIFFTILITLILGNLLLDVNAEEVLADTTITPSETNITDYNKVIKTPIKDILFVQKNNQWALISQNKPVNGTFYDEVIPFTNVENSQYYKVKKNGLYGFIDIKSLYESEIKYEDIRLMKKGTTYFPQVNLNQKWRYDDKTKKDIEAYNELNPKRNTESTNVPNIVPNLLFMIPQAPEM